MGGKCLVLLLVQTVDKQVTLLLPLPTQDTLMAVSFSFGDNLVEFCYNIQHGHLSPQTQLVLTYLLLHTRGCTIYVLIITTAFLGKQKVVYYDAKPLLFGSQSI